MDTVDKKILFSLLKDGRTPQRQIAKEIGISAQTLNYRMTKMIEDGIIVGFIVHINSKILGKVEAFAAYVSDKEIDTGYFTRLKCLEKITLYGFDGDTVDEVEKKIEDASLKLGQPVMKYRPEINSYSENSKNIDFQIIDQLKKTPRAKISEIAKALDMPVIRIKRRYNFLRKSHLVAVMAKIDLSKTDVVIFSIFTTDQEKIEHILEDVTIFKITDNSTGVFICFAENMVSARALINSSREAEKKSEVMVIYDYEFIH
jgi:DNA-binding Lrp family transcriptional regulator